MREQHDGRAGPIPTRFGADAIDEGPRGVLGRPVPIDAAREHVAGTAPFIDDIPPARNELLVEFVGSPFAHARIEGIDVSDARKIEGIAAVLTHADVPGTNAFGPIFQDEELLAETVCSYIGQPVVVIAGESRPALQAARAAVRLDLEELPAVLTIDEAIAREQFIGPTRRIARGDVEAGFTAAEHVIEGTLWTGGQDHFYLETQAAIAIPEGGGMLTIHSSTQNPSEIQSLVAQCLGLRQNQVVCICARMGGGFGGKETQAAHPAIMAALVALKTGRPARIVYSRHLDMRVTGKRHPYRCRYKVGFEGNGRITALAIDFDSDGGASADLSLAVMERSLLHAENAYYIPHVSLTGTVCRTNLPSNTAFRGFGGPQGIAAMENVIEDVATRLGIDPFDVRRSNVYEGPGRETTPYGQVLPSNTLPTLLDRLAESSDYRRRRAEVGRFNASSRTEARGLGLTPVKFGISFTRRTLNQANALVNIYLDGTIQVSTGGTEMGQGLNTKIAQLVADQFAVPIEAVRVMPTSTEKNNNTSPTAASASTDLNGWAAVRASETLKARLSDVAARRFADPAEGIEASPTHVVFEEGDVLDARRPSTRIGFGALVRLAYEQRVDLGARGFYATPGVDFNWETGKGNPFLYFTNGCALAEVVIDRLTGELKVEAVHILIDIGRPLNPAIDLGQVVGGFVQGLGWVTLEELRYGESGELLTCSPSTYKIPSINDLPAEFRVDFHDDPGDRLNLFGSKAVGEPPFVLGLCVWAAVKDALRDVAPGKGRGLRLPATTEEVLRHLSGTERATEITENIQRESRADGRMETVPLARTRDFLH